MIKYSKSVLFEGQTHICVKKYCSGWPTLSLAGAATSIIFVVTKLLLQQTHVCRDKKLLSRQYYVCHGKHTFVMTKDVFCRDKHVFIATKLSSQQKLYLLQFPPMIQHHTGFYQIKNRTFCFGI